MGRTYRGSEAVNSLNRIFVLDHHGLRGSNGSEATDYSTVAAAPVDLPKPKKSWLSIDWDFSDSFAQLEKKYKKRKRPITVNFRDLVPIHSGADRSTHLLHSYPAKLLANIPIFFLNCKQLRAPGGVVLDPFCGTGTVLIEAVLSGHKVFGADANPLARLIAKTKLTPISETSIRNASAQIRTRVKLIKPVVFSPVVNVDKWFCPSVKEKLGRLLAAIREIENTSVRRFFEVCFSNCLRKVSLADMRTTVPVRKGMAEKGRPADVMKLFEQCVKANSRRISTLKSIDGNLLRHIPIVSDARRLKTVKSIRADLIITSPPYLGAQKYIRASSLSIGWLGLAPKNKLRMLERQSIGREHFSKREYETLDVKNVGKADVALRHFWKLNPLRAHIAATYLKEMRAALSEACDNLQIGGHFVLIIGDNSLCGKPFRTSKYMRALLVENRLRLRLELVDAIRSRGLMTKRNKTAGLISQEHIYVFQKK